MKLLLSPGLKEEIETKVVSSVEDILSEQIGVTTQDNEIQ